MNCEQYQQQFAVFRRHRWRLTNKLLVPLNNCTSAEALPSSFLFQNKPSVQDFIFYRNAWLVLFIVDSVCACVRSFLWRRGFSRGAQRDASISQPRQLVFVNVPVKNDLQGQRKRFGEGTFLRRILRLELSRWPSLPPASRQQFCSC